MYTARDYRDKVAPDLALRRLAVGETDLAVCLEPAAWEGGLEEAVLGLIVGLRDELMEYIRLDPLFFTTHQPHLVREDAPGLAKEMARAANLAGVGPMAAVAGAFAQAVGKFLLPYSAEVIVENGGDIYLSGRRERIVAVFAGGSPFSQRVGLRIKPKQLPLGVCTSSGTVGPSYSYGKADALVVIAPDTLLADAAATACANLVQNKGDLDKAVKMAQSITGVSGVLAVKDDALAAWGEIELVDI